jgi:hypothetical protein
MTDTQETLQGARQRIKEIIPHHSQGIRSLLGLILIALIIIPVCGCRRTMMGDFRLPLSAAQQQSHNARPRAYNRCQGGGIPQNCSMALFASMKILTSSRTLPAHGGFPKTSSRTRFASGMTPGSATGERSRPMTSNIHSSACLRRRQRPPSPGCSIRSRERTISSRAGPQAYQAFMWWMTIRSCLSSKNPSGHSCHS